MGLWAGAELNSEVSGRFVDRVQTLVDDESAWRRWTAQDLGLMLSGTSAQVQFDPKRWREPARRLHAYLVTNLGETGTGLFFNNAAGLRRRITSYATGVYCTLGCFHYGEALEYPPAIERAMRCVDALNFHQGPLGEWPWLYDAVRDVVVDHYPIYSVHQDGMAPAYLHHAVKHGGSIYREPIERGFAWIFGTNQMKHSMLESNKGLVVRGQCRREGLPRYRRAFRAVGNAWLGRRSDYVPPSKLELIPECRSYHLGWMLWSFGGRNDFPAITHAEPFRRSRDGQPASEQAS
jgi:hypothetical protein